MGAADACGRWHWGLRWSSLWGHTKRVRGVSKWVQGSWPRHRRKTTRGEKPAPGRGSRPRGPAW
eukprot:1606725-Pyramimonas_sp.AAC.1